MITSNRFPPHVRFLSRVDAEEHLDETVLVHDFDVDRFVLGGVYTFSFDREDNRLRVPESFMFAAAISRVPVVKDLDQPIICVVDDIYVFTLEVTLREL
jgi:hypothetical protein